MRKFPFLPLAVALNFVLTAWCLVKLQRLTPSSVAARGQFESLGELPSGSSGPPVVSVTIPAATPAPGDGPVDPKGGGAAPPLFNVLPSIPPSPPPKLDASSSELAIQLRIDGPSLAVLADRSGKIPPGTRQALLSVQPEIERLARTLNAPGEKANPLYNVVNNYIVHTIPSRRRGGPVAAQELVQARTQLLVQTQAFFGEPGARLMQQNIERFAIK